MGHTERHFGSSEFSSLWLFSLLAPATRYSGQALCPVLSVHSSWECRPAPSCCTTTRTLCTEKFREQEVRWPFFPWWRPLTLRHERGQPLQPSQKRERLVFRIWVKMPLGQEGLVVSAEATGELGGVGQRMESETLLHLSDRSMNYTCGQEGWPGGCPGGAALQRTAHLACTFCFLDTGFCSSFKKQMSIIIQKKVVFYCL